jgi:N-acetylglucosamine kinase-like BadF-type ATPase
MQIDELVLGIDGGGTKTVAWLARRSGSAGAEVIGRGAAGPSNIQAVGAEAALESLDQAVGGAFQDARLGRGRVAAAVLGLAGSEREENQRMLGEWAERRRVAARFRVVNDALPVLAAGTPEGWGVALISGTGSFAFGQSRDGRTARVGGWGYLFGDEGSGYAIAIAGLRAAAQAADGCGEETLLLEAFLRRFDLRQPLDLISTVYRFAGDRARIASLAEVVFRAADQEDSTASHIVLRAGADLAGAAAAVARRLGFSPGEYPLVLSGGLLLRERLLRTYLGTGFYVNKWEPASMTLVEHPVAGAVRLALAERRSSENGEGLR